MYIIAYTIAYSAIKYMIIIVKKLGKKL